MPTPWSVASFEALDVAEERLPVADGEGERATVAVQAPNAWVDPRPRAAHPDQSSRSSMSRPTALCRTAGMNRSMRFGVVGQRWMTVELTDDAGQMIKDPTAATGDQALDLLLRE
jgi:hypothetical protein